MPGVEVVFIADDFGWTRDINVAVVRAHTHGVLTGASLMVGQPATADAVARAREHPTLQTGWHLHLCHSQPLTRAAWPWGDSYTKAGWAIGLQSSARQLIRDEIAAQWDAYRATGLPCAFVNVHHHLHAHPYVWRVLRRTLPRDFAGWIRFGTPMNFARLDANQLLSVWMKRRRAKCPWRSTDTLWGADRIGKMQSPEVRHARAILPDGFHEFMFHPCAVENDGDLRALIELRTQS